jgi:hypothetical protein
MAVLCILMTIAFWGCVSQSTKQESKRLSTDDLTVSQSVLSEELFKIEEYNFNDLVNGKDFRVYSFGQTGCELLILHESSISIIKVDYLNMEITNENHFDMPMGYEILEVYPGGLFFIEVISPDQKDFLFLSFEDGNKYILQENIISNPMITVIRDNYFYSGTSMITKNELKTSICKFSMNDKTIDELISYDFKGDESNQNGNRILAFGTSYMGEGSSSPNYLYYQLVELKNQKLSDVIHGDFQIVKFDYVKKEVTDSWIINEPFYKMWGFNDGAEDYVVYCKRTKEIHREDRVKLMNLTSKEGVLFKEIANVMDMSDLIPIDFSNKTFIAGDSSGAYLLDFTKGTIAHLTSEFEEGIEKILLDHHGVYL